MTVAVVCAHAADALGNLVYDKTARNFNADMATVIAVATPHLFVGSLVPECTLPLAAERPVDLIVTERATFAVRDGGLVLTEVAPGASREWIAGHTAAPYREAP